MFKQFYVAVDKIMSNKKRTVLKQRTLQDICNSQVKMLRKKSITLISIRNAFESFLEGLIIYTHRQIHWHMKI